MYEPPAQAAEVIKINPSSGYRPECAKQHPHSPQNKRGETHQGEAEYQHKGRRTPSAPSMRLVSGGYFFSSMATVVKDESP